MQEEVLNIKNQAVGRIMEAQSLGELAEIETEYLGRQGYLTSQIKSMSTLPKEERKTAGLVINEAKVTILDMLSSRRVQLKDKKEWFDTTIPGIKPPIGHLHLVTQAIEEITSVYERIGFVRLRYPEVDWDWFAFGSLNFPDIHPARDDWETFFVDASPNPKYGAMVLTPHTSNGQVREMHRAKNPPIRMVNIAKCYRRQSDVSHVPMFHQFEGLVIDKGIAITNLKGTLDYFAKNFFGEGRKTRLRPYNFRFTEPSFEVDISCDICGGTGMAGNQKCRICKQGWLELGGAGMVHPNVLKNGGIDPNIYTGFAFGWGVERTFMMKAGLSIPDIRLLYSADLRFLRQF